MEDVTPERWLSVIGYEGWYEVSDLGRVRRVRAGRGSRPGKILKASPDHHGHLGVYLSRYSAPKRFPVHRLVAEAFIGPRPEDLDTRHLNGVWTDNRAANLTYGTRSDNMQDAIRHGTNHNLNKTHCVNGHEFTPENTSRDSRGGRRCRLCHRVESRERMRRKAKERRAERDAA
jgi:hypothetical protein